MTQTVAIPPEYRDLIDEPNVATLVTVNPDGQPQATPVWVDFDGTYVRVNSAEGRQKVRNMRERPKVSLLIIDPNNMYRWMEIRGTVVQITAEDGVDHINSLSAKYRNQPDYYARMPHLRGKETRLVFRIQPSKVIAQG